MSINFVVVNLEGDVEITVESVCEYLGYNPDTMGKDIDGQTYSAPITMVSDTLAKAVFFQLNDSKLTSELFMILFKGYTNRERDRTGYIANELFEFFKISSHLSKVTAALTYSEEKAACFIFKVNITAIVDELASQRRQFFHAVD